VFTPEPGAATDAVRGKKNLAVFVPRFGFFRRSGNGFENILAFFGFIEQGFQFRR